MAISDTGYNAFGDNENGFYLTGQLLVAMPGIGDQRFDKTVIYL